MTHGSLFSGLGGFDLAAEYVGWTNVFCCERDEFCQRVLQHHFPKSKLYDDVKTFKADKYFGRIDVLTGGFPCQPFSTAGKRQGTEDERHLWPEMLRIIRECSPRWIVGENVRGLVNWNGGLVFEEVCADLETCGYSVQPFILPAAAVNAPHRRDRVWFVAHANKRNDGRTTGEDARESGEERIQERNSIRKPKESDSLRESSPDTEHHGQPSTKGGRSNGTDSERSEKGQEVTEQFEGVRESQKLGGVYDSDTHNERLQRGQKEGDARSGWKGSDQQPPRRIRTTWEDFPTEPPLCGGDDGISQELDGITFPKWRRESLKGYGNAVCVPLVMNIFEAIKNYDETI